MTSRNQWPFVASVIIPTYGRPAGLRSILEQLLEQDVGDLTYEIIVVDDGSPEPLAPTVEGFARRAEIPVRCLRKSNGGPASARNYGARAAKGEYLLFVDDDISISSDYIRGHIETHEMFGPALVICDFEWQVNGKPEPFRRWHQQRANQWIASRRVQARPVSEDVLVIPSVLVASALLSMRRVDFELAGGIDESYSYGACEDQDFAEQIRRNGIRTLMTRKTTAVHIETHNGLKQLCRRQRNGAEDTVRFVRRLAIAELHGAPPIERVNGPVSLRVDSWSLVAKKVIKQVVASRHLSPIVFAGVSLLERIIPESRLLPRVYDLVVGAYIQRGWRDGLEKHRAVTPAKPVLQAEVNEP